MFEIEFYDRMMQNNKNAVFVYGSNKLGIHGSGAAKTAYEKYEAIWGKTGYAGQSYGISTKASPKQSLSLLEITDEINDFFEFAIERLKDQDTLFLITEVGCGLAGYSPIDIAPIFADNLEVMYTELADPLICNSFFFPRSFREYLPKWYKPHPYLLNKIYKSV
jgi:hypothetical protein